MGPRSPSLRFTLVHHDYLRALRRGRLINDYLERTGQREPFKTAFGIDFNRLHAHFRPLYELLNDLDKLDREPGVSG